MLTCKGRIKRCRQFVPTKITELRVNVRKVIFTEVDHALPVE